MKLADIPGCMDVDVVVEDIQSAWTAVLPPMKWNQRLERMDHHGHWPVQLPSWLPECDHCVLRWEWIAFTGVPTTTPPEMYATCSDIRIAPAPSGEAGEKLTPDAAAAY